VGVVASEEIGVGVSHGGGSWAGRGWSGAEDRRREEVWMGGRGGSIIERERRGCSCCTL
jgi:hypothetical protein